MSSSSSNNNNGGNKKKQQYKRPRNDKRQQQKQDGKADETPKEQDVVDLLVSGLPLAKDQLSVDDLYQTFRKAGFIQEIEEGVPRIHFLADEETGERIGKAVICFARKESIPLAIKLFDGIELVKGYPITLREAQGEEIITKADPSLSSKKNKRNSRLDKKKDADYGWGESESRVVVLKNLFDPIESWTNPNFFEELKEDIEAGCERCGEIQSITIFERNPEGVATVKFKEFEAAERCVALMEGRYFAQRQLKADFYDGYTDYHVEETEEERELRLKVWEKYLEEEDNKEDSSDNDHTNNKKDQQQAPEEQESD